MRHRRLLTLAAAATAIAFLPGCVKIGPINGSQEAVTGPLVLDVPVCTTEQGGPLTACGDSSNDSGVAQLMVAVQASSSATMPESLYVDATAPGSLADLTLTANSSYSAAMQALEPAPAGRVWKGYIGRPGSFTTTTATGVVQARIAPGGGTGPVLVAMVAGWRIAGGGAGYEDNRPVVCGDPLEGGVSNPQAACAVTRTPGSGALAFAVNRVSLEAPAPVSAPAGTTATVPFVLGGSAERTPGLPITLGATTTIPGATPLVPSGLQLGASGPTSVQVAVPAGTPPGNYTVELTVTALGTELRKVAAVVTVPAPAAPGVPGVPGVPAGPGVEPVLTPSAAVNEASTAVVAALGASGARKALRSGKLRFNFKAPRSGKLRLVVQRRSRGKTTTAVTIATASRTISKAGNTLVVVRLTKVGRTLVNRPGKLRLKVTTSFRAGGKTTVKTRNATLR